MGKETSIAWTDHTFNPWWGCTRVSPGCDNCYAEAFDKRVGGAHWGKDMPRRTFGDAHWDEPLAWNRAAREEGKSARVFCASMADVMDDEAPDGGRKRLWELIDSTPYLTWLLLTKRPQRYGRYLPESFRPFAHNNVLLGATAENQHFYNLRWGILRQVAADFDLRTFISYEPALGELSMDAYEPPEASTAPDYPSWIIFGGETGPRPRPMQQWWAEQLKEEAESAGVAFFVKQMSARTPAKAAELIPAHLLIREFPEAR